MKLMIASDLHGSLYYAEKMIELYQAEHASRLILLGDLLYHGPRNDLPKEYNPKGVIALLNGMKDKVLCVRGNCDADVDQMVLDFPIMAESMILYMGERLVFATHGHIYNNDTPPKIGEKDILLHGHTHVSAVQDMGNYTYLNPGSIALPKDGHHSYMVCDENRFLIKDIAGDVLKELILK